MFQNDFCLACLGLHYSTNTTLVSRQKHPEFGHKMYKVTCNIWKSVNHRLSNKKIFREKSKNCIFEPSLQTVTLENG